MIINEGCNHSKIGPRGADGVGAHCAFMECPNYRSKCSLHAIVSTRREDGCNLRMPTYIIEVGELTVRTDDERVNLIHHPSDGRRSFMLSLSPMAAHNLGVVLPDHATEAGGNTIAGSMKIMSGAEDTENRMEYAQRMADEADLLDHGGDDVDLPAHDT